MLVYENKLCFTFLIVVIVRYVSYTKAIRAKVIPAIKRQYLRVLNCLI